jgi:hypothetical protein
MPQSKGASRSRRNHIVRSSPIEVGRQLLVGDSDTAPAHAYAVVPQAARCDKRIYRRGAYFEPPCRLLHFHSTPQIFTDNVAVADGEANRGVGDGNVVATGWFQSGDDFLARAEPP